MGSLTALSTMLILRLHIIVHTVVQVCVRVYMERYPQWPEKSVGPSGAGDTGSCKSPDMGIRNLT